MAAPNMTGKDIHIDLGDMSKDMDSKITVGGVPEVKKSSRGFFCCVGVTLSSVIAIMVMIIYAISTLASSLNADTNARESGILHERQIYQRGLRFPPIPPFLGPHVTNTSSLVTGTSATLFVTGSAVTYVTVSATVASDSSSVASAGLFSAGDVRGSVDGTLTITSASNTVTKTRTVTPTEVVIVTPGESAVQASATTSSPIPVSSPIDIDECSSDVFYFTVTKIVSPIDGAQQSTTTEVGVPVVSGEPITRTKTVTIIGGKTETASVLTVVPPPQISSSSSDVTDVVTVTHQDTVIVTVTEIVGETGVADADSVDKASLTTHTPSNYATTKVVGVEETIYVTNTAPAVNVSYTVVQHSHPTFSSTGVLTITDDTAHLGEPTLGASATPSDDTSSGVEKNGIGSGNARVLVVIMAIAGISLLL